MSRTQSRSRWQGASKPIRGWQGGRGFGPRAIGRANAEAIADIGYISCRLHRIDGSLPSPENSENDEIWGPPLQSHRLAKMHCKQRSYSDTTELPKPRSPLESVEPKPTAKAKNPFRI